MEFSNREAEARQMYCFFGVVGGGANVYRTDMNIALLLTASPLNAGDVFDVVFLCCPFPPRCLG